MFSFAKQFFAGFRRAGELRSTGASARPADASRRETFVGSVAYDKRMRCNQFLACQLTKDRPARSGSNSRESFSRQNEREGKNSGIEMMNFFHPIILVRTQSDRICQWPSFKNSSPIYSQRRSGRRSRALRTSERRFVFAPKKFFGYLAPTKAGVS